MFKALSKSLTNVLVAVIALALFAPEADAARGGGPRGGGGGGRPAGGPPAGARPAPTAKPAAPHPAPGPRVAGASARRPAHVRTAPGPAVVRRPPLPGPRARTLPPVMRPVRYGTVVRSLADFQPLVIRDRRFAVRDGIYYLPQPGSDRYVVVRPPVGVIVPKLPLDYLIATVGGVDYYFYDDTWYDESLQVVEVPVGGFIEHLPDAYDVVTIDGERYYRVGGLYYRESTRDCRTVYERVGVETDPPTDKERGSDESICDSRGATVDNAAASTKSTD